MWDNELRIIEDWFRNQLVQSTPANCEALLYECGAFGDQFLGGRQCLLGALTLALYVPASEVFEFICKHRDADTDTMCLITGALLPIVNGDLYNPVPGLPDYKKLMNYQLIIRLIDNFVDGIQYSYIKATTKQKKLRANLFPLGRANEFIPGLGRMQLIKTEQLENMAPNLVYRYTIKTEIGQTLYIKQYRKANK